MRQKTDDFDATRAVEEVSRPASSLTTRTRREKSKVVGSYLKPTLSSMRKIGLS